MIVWKRAIAVISGKGGSILFAVLQTLLINSSKKHFKLL